MTPLFSLSSLRNIRKRAAGIPAAFAVGLACITGLALSSCSSWWVGSGGWGVSETMPGGVNVGISAPWPAQYNYRPYRPHPYVRPWGPVPAVRPYPVGVGPAVPWRPVPPVGPF